MANTGNRREERDMHDSTMQETAGATPGEGAIAHATRQVQEHDEAAGDARPVQEAIGEARSVTLSDEAQEAIERALVGVMRTDGPFGNGMSVEVCEDVAFYVYGGVLESGWYVYDESVPNFAGKLMRLIVEDLRLMLDDGTVITQSEATSDLVKDQGEVGIKFAMNAEPVKLAGADVTPTLQELAAWVAWASERKAGRPHVAAEIIDAIYTPNDGGRSASEISADNESRALEGERDGLQLPRQDMVKPTTHYVPNSKFANMIAEVASFNGETVELDVSSAKEQRAGREVLSAVSVSMEDVEGLDVNKPIDAFDSDAQSAVATLYVAGNEYMTPAQICQTLTGSKKPTKKQIDDVEKSIDKQMRAYAKADMTAEARGRRLKIDGSPVTSYMLEGYLIPAEKVRIRSANGRMVSGYHMLKAPLLYRHAHELGQVVSFPQKMLETDTAGSNTRTRSAIKNYLARRIGQIKGKGGVSNRILLSKMYEKAEVDPENRKQRNAANKYASELLDLWSEKGFITSYRKESQGSSHRLIAFVINA